MMIRSVVVFCMPGEGHIQRFLPLIQGLSARGRTVHVLAHRRYRAQVERVGGCFFDLFTRYPVDAADATSFPLATRLVTFAGVYAESLSAALAALGPGVVVYDTFAVVAPLIARRLRIPYVNVCCRTVAAFRQEPRVAISPECWAAAERLRDVHGIHGANPFSFAENQSPFLNVYCEPPEFLDAADRAAFEPITFFGSLAPDLREGNAVEVFPRTRRGPRIYVSFGTVIWRYYEALARAALEVISRTCADFGVDVVISLGRHKLEAAARVALERPNVQVVDYADQWAALRQADVFITHHGLNSTHEAIFHEVPMLSYPFFGDQPAQARCCQDLGLAVPLTTEPRAPLDRATLLAAMQRLSDEREEFAARLAEARSWELRTIAERGAVIDRILGLMRDE
jgi:MGT family glycosyltransferase